LSEEAEILARLRRGERLDHYETVRVAKDGRRLDISLTVSPLRNTSGEIIGAAKVARDITEKKRGANALAQQQEWFRVTLNSIGDAVIASDRDSRVTFLNHEAERLCGWTSAEAEGHALDEVFHILHEETRERVGNPAERVLRNKRSASLSNHTALISRDGTEWPIADSAAPIVDREGTIVGVVLVFREISEERRTEERNRKAAAERERLLQSERAARSEAEKANRVKDDFVAMVSHELRTPLNAILGWTELLKRTPGDAVNVERGLDVIARNTRLQAQLIMDLLDVSRIVSGKIHLELDRVDLGPIVQASIEALEPTADEMGVTLTAQVDPDPTPILGDPSRLQQVVWNLVSNAVKFTPPGGTVAIGMRRAGDNALVTVTDSGMGIRPEIMPEIFERFRQGAGMTTRRHGGLGLGLSITKHLVELHGGSIRASSAGEDRGATFTVELPVIRSEPFAAEVRSENQAATARAADVSLHGMRILVVEDELDTRDLIRRLLEAHRAEVIVAASALEALELLESARPDLVVSDIGLPDVDGYEFIQRMRSLDGSLGRLPAVALTAFARLEDRTRALKSGFNAHVTKPVEPAELVLTVGSFANLITSNRQVSTG
jgi:PAS domain S-box-containing protein